MKIRILTGDDARSYLSCQEFLRGWRSLCEGCGWSTACQTPEFAMAWYETYGSMAEPLLVVAMAPDDNAPDGLLALAIEGGSDRIFNVGDHQSEYHGWVARADLENEFIVAALKALRARYPDKSLRFRYLPPDAPTSWLSGTGELSGLLTTRQVSRPLIRLRDERDYEASFRKKSNKSRLNRLRKAGGGELTFGALASESELAEIIDEIALHYDLRQGAVNGATPFHDDAFKKDFYCKLMNAGLLHAFVLRAGPALASAILSMKSRDCLSIGVFAHSIQLTRHSPGKFGVLFLSRAALRDGYRVIDLTPSGEWKERFANDRDGVLEVTVWFSRAAAAGAIWGEKALMLAKRTLALFGVKPQDLRDAVALLRRATPAAIARRLKRLAWDDREFRVYYYEAEKAAALTPAGTMKRDSIDDLLRFEATSPWLSRNDFLARALVQLAKGSHVYTAAEGERLDHYGWLTESAGESYFTEVGAKFDYPPNSAVLFDYHTHRPATAGYKNLERRFTAKQDVLQPGFLLTAQHRLACKIRGGIRITVIAHVQEEEINAAVFVTKKYSRCIVLTIVGIRPITLKCCQ